MCVCVRVCVLACTLTFIVIIVSVTPPLCVYLPPSLSPSPFPSLLGEAEPDESPPTAEDRQKIFKVREQLGELSSLSL